MRAIRVAALGGLEQLRLTEIPSPVPGPGQVRIAVHAAGCNFADTLMVQGVYQHRPDLPFTPGMEVAGTVIDCGADVAGWAPGDRVMSWVPSGGYAEEALVPASALIRMPPEMDFVAAASFPVTYSTSLVALTHPRVALQGGERLLVLGAAGGVGLAGVDVGKAMGATVIAAAGGAAKLGIAAAHGADHLIDYRRESIRDRVTALVGGVDVVLDPVGGDAFAQALRCINTDGRLVIVGFAGGTVPQIPANRLLLKNATAVGFSVGAYRRARPEAVAGCFDRLLEWHAVGRLRPHVSHTFALPDTAAALNTLLARKATGKVVVTIR